MHISKTTSTKMIRTVFTPFLDAAWNLSVKYPGYSLAEYKAGIWIRENTPMNADLLSGVSAFIRD